MYKPTEPSNLPQVIKKIGAGTYGEVFLCMDGKEKCAVKRLIQKKQHIDKSQYAEIAAARYFNHPNIVNAQRVYVSNNQICIQMEFCDTNIQSIFEARPQAEERKEIYRQLLEGLKYLHDRSFLHCDLKPANILVRLEKIPGTYQVKNLFKILDFGLGVFINRNYFSPGVRNPSHRWRWTDGYRPPEVMAGVPDLSLRADVWSLGVSFITLLNGGNPFLYNGEDVGIQHYSNQYQTDIKKLTTAILNNEPHIQTNFEFLAPLQSKVTEQELDLLKQMLQLDPRLRWDCATLLNHPFLQNIDPKAAKFAGQGLLANLVPTHQQMFGQLGSEQENQLVD